MRDFHALGVAAISSGRPAEGARLLRAGLRVLDPADHALAARLMISLASAEVQLGRSERGFELLDQAEHIVALNDRPILWQQRGLLLMLVGRMAEAVGYMDAAIPLISEETDPVRLAKTLLNRAMLHELAGRVRQARSDLEWCERLARAADQPLLLAQVRLNRGYSNTLVGDIPAALRVFDQAKIGFAEHAPALLPVLAVDKARALLGAGLADEAAAELDAGLAGLSGITHERAEAELTRAQVAVAQGNLALARTWARRAERHFRRRGNESWAAVAVLTRLRAEFRTGKGLRGLAAEAAGLVHTLQDLGLPHDAEVASLLAARASTALGRLGDTRAHLSARIDSRPVLELKLLRRLTSAELHMAEGDRRRAVALARSGLALLGEHRSRFGSVDMQTGTATLGVELAQIGLRDSLRQGKPVAVFSWLERSRAQAFRLRPVRPSADPETAVAVAELRQLAVVTRTAELAGRRNVEAERRCAALEREIRARGWLAEGDGRHSAVAEFRAVAEELGDSTLVSFLSDGGQLRAVVVRNGVGRLVDAGDLAVVRETAARLRSDLDALCGRRLRAAIAEVIAGSVERQLAALTENLIAPLRKYLGDGELVVVPTGPLFTIPWGLLPDLRGRPVTVAASASVWLRGRQRTVQVRTDAPLLVAGPHLDHAAGEVRKIAGIFPESTVLEGSDATVAATLKVLDGRRIAHFAAHGHHEAGNVLFSRLDLVDGPLMAYDIHQLRTLPEHVVLSSCDVGRTVVRTGDEMLGFTAALLYGGTKTVVASVARVDDDAAVDVMAIYHELLARDVSPSHALAEASLVAPLIPLVCFGSS